MRVKGFEALAPDNDNVLFNPHLLLLLSV